MGVAEGDLDGRRIKELDVLLKILRKVWVNGVKGRVGPTLFLAEVDGERFLVLNFKPTIILLGEKVFGEERVRFSRCQLGRVKRGRDIWGQFQEQGLEGINEPGVKLVQDLFWMCLVVVFAVVSDGSDKLAIPSLDDGRIANEKWRQQDVEFAAVATLETKT